MNPLTNGFFKSVMLGGNGVGESVGEMYCLGLVILFADVSCIDTGIVEGTDNWIEEARNRNCGKNNEASNKKFFIMF